MSYEKNFKNSKMTHHHKIHEGDRIKRNVPEIHDAEHVGDYHQDGNEDHDRRMNVKTQEDEGNDENCRHRNAQTGQNVSPHSQVLFVEDVEDAVWENFNLMALGAEWQGNVVSNDTSFAQSGVKILGSLHDSVIGHEVIGTHSQVLFQTIVDHALFTFKYWKM